MDVPIQTAHESQKDNRIQSIARTAFVSAAFPSLQTHHRFRSASTKSVIRFTAPPLRRRVSMAAPAPPPPSDSPYSATAPTETSMATSPSFSSSRKSFNWLDHWYPAAWEDDVPNGKPISFTIWQRKYVLFRDSVTGLFVVMDDVCPHRAAPLSEGRLYQRDSSEGKKETILECGYHGWRFNCSGRCVDIPVVALEKKIPAAADVGGVYATHVSIAGLIFVWLGDRAKADESKIPVPKELLDPRARLVTFRNSHRRFPFSFATLTENIVDPAHVQWSHHGTGQGNRNNVPRNGALEILEQNDSDGYMKSGIRVGDSPSHRLYLKYQAPCAVIYESVTSRIGNFFLLAYPVPVDHNQSALFIVNVARDFARIPSIIKKYTPRWFEHTISNLILDGDALLLQWQEVHLQKHKRDLHGGAWKNEFALASGTWDSMVVHFRNWLDKHNDSMPYLTSTPLQAPPQNMTREMINDRYEYHTKDCASCRPALRNFRIGRIAAFVGAWMMAGMVLFSGILYTALSAGGVPFSARPLKIFAGVGMVFGVFFLALAKVMTHFIKLLTYTEVSYDLAHAE